MVSMQLLLLSVFDVTAVRLRWTGVMLLYAAAVLSCTSAAGYFKTVAARRLYNCDAGLARTNSMHSVE